MREPMSKAERAAQVGDKPNVDVRIFLPNIEYLGLKAGVHLFPLVKITKGAR